MCEIEKATGTTKETINSFWNTKLLFIVPFSVIDDIYNDPTHTLARTTEHTLHHEYAMTMTGMTVTVTRIVAIRRIVQRCRVQDVGSLGSQETF